MVPWLQIVSPIVAIIVAVIAVMRVLHRLESRLEHIEIRIATIESQNRALLKAFPQVVSSMMRANLVSTDKGIELLAGTLQSESIVEILAKIQPKGNPLSQDEVNRVRSYVVRIQQGQWLQPDETREFYRLSEIITREYPSSEGSWILFLIGGILLGALIAGSGPSKK